MSKILNSVSNTRKNPLTLMESPENGRVHSYGSPVSKSSNPCTVKQVKTLKENIKWFSPDETLTKDGTGVNKKCNFKKSKTGTVKQEKRSSSSPAVSTAHQRRRRYPKLDFDTNGGFNEKDENKENIQPSSRPVFVNSPDSPKPESSSRKFIGDTNRVKLI